MLEKTTSIFPNRAIEEFVEDIKSITQEIQELYCLDSIPWIIGVSWGKDSTAVLQLVWNAIASLPEEKRHKTIYVITTDTLVENPIVSSWVNKCIKKLEISAKDHQIPIKPYQINPSVKETFWVCLIGKGYPAPRRGFRWCTERLKITPTNHFIRQQIRENGEVILKILL